jgi:glycosyltransferase involved in cell wall biosynthesis
LPRPGWKSAGAIALLCSGVAWASLPRVGDIPSFVTDGVHALLYRPGDTNDFAQKLRQLRDDPDLRVRLGTAGRALVVDTATWDVRLTELLDSAPFRAAVARTSDPA